MLTQSDLFLAAAGRVADGFDEEGDHMRGVVVDQIVHVVGEPEGRFVARQAPHAIQPRMGFEPMCTIFEPMPFFSSCPATSLRAV